jgi:hypothetical protein
MANEMPRRLSSKGLFHFGFRTSQCRRADDVAGKRGSFTTALRDAKGDGGGKKSITRAHRRWREQFPEFIENSPAVANVSDKKGKKRVAGRKHLDA